MALVSLMRLPCWRDRLLRGDHLEGTSSDPYTAFSKVDPMYHNFQQEFVNCARALSSLSVNHNCGLAGPSVRQLGKYSSPSDGSRVPQANSDAELPTHAYVWGKSSRQGKTFDEAQCQAQTAKAPRA